MIKKVLKFQFDLIVVGAGSGGLAAAKRAASYGIKLAEHALLGDVFQKN